MDTGHWKPNYNQLGESFDPSTFFGFVYKITRRDTGRSYIGKKQLIFTERRKVKGRVNRKHVKKESDWKTYTGSCEELNTEIEKCDFKNPNNTLISNVTSEEVNDSSLLKELLIKQIENRVRWRESINYMIKNKINKFIEIGPGKVLSGLIKKINRDVNISNINYINNIKND